MPVAVVVDRSGAADLEPGFRAAFRIELADVPAVALDGSHKRDVMVFAHRVRIRKQLRFYGPKKETASPERNSHHVL